MQKLCIFTGMTVASYLGWYLGSLIGGIMTAFFISGLASLVGIWAGWSVFQRYFA